MTCESLGMGDLLATARDIRDDARLVPVVLCGTDERLRRRLARVPGVVALGWLDDVPDLMASGTPVVTYRPLAGHGVTNCTNLDRVGLVHGPAPAASCPPTLPRASSPRARAGCPWTRRTSVTCSSIAARRWQREIVGTRLARLTGQ
ncbi:hypothetical protein DUHN55_37450 [Helicobacter pylori]